MADVTDAAENTPAGTAHGSDEGTSESVITVFVAGAANLLIAAAKAVGAMISGSSSMLSEAAHSFADTVTEVLLYISLRRSGKPADARHPLGYGREAYLWALLAAVATFVAGAVVSVWDGVDRIRHGGDQGSPTIAFIVLAVAFVLEGTSFMRAARQVSGSARRYRVPRRTFLQETTDTAVRAVTFEDSAALVGLVLAAVGLGLTTITGSSLWDGLSSVLIGLLLVVVAGSLAAANTSLLVGRSAPLGLDQALRADLEGLSDDRLRARLRDHGDRAAPAPRRGEGGVPRRVHDGRHRAHRGRGGAPSAGTLPRHRLRLPRPDVQLRRAHRAPAAGR